MPPYKLTAFFLVLGVLCLATVDSSKSQAQDKPQILIGAIASLTGPAAEQGRNWLDGAELAVDNLREEGKNVRLIVEDDATNAAKATTAFKKLVIVDGVKAIVGGTWDFTAQAVFPLAASSRSHSSPRPIL